MDYFSYVTQILAHHRFPPHRADYEKLCYDWFHVEAGKGSSIDTIIASSGSAPAWIAYRQSIAKVAPEYKKNFAGKRDLAVLLGRLQTAEESVQKRVAKGLKDLLIHEERKWAKRLRKVLKARCSQSKFSAAIFPSNRNANNTMEKVPMNDYLPHQTTLGIDG